MMHVIIVSFNGERLIKNCVNSLLGSDEKPQIIVVDNGSTDETVSEIPEDRHIHIIRLEKNIGFGRANNIGISVALSNGAESVFLLNQDATLERSCLTTLQKALIDHADYGVISPIHLNSEGNNFDKNFLVTYLAQSNTPFLFDSYIGATHDVYEIPAVNAAAWLVSRQLLEETGGFDPLFFMYGEDDDLLIRAKRNGFKVGIVPKARITHFRSNEDIEKRGSRMQYIRKVRNRERSTMILFLKSYDGYFFRAIIELSAINVVKLIRAAIVERYPLNILALLGAITDILFILTSIRRHRHISKMQGPHWIELNGPLDFPN